MLNSPLPAQSTLSHSPFAGGRKRRTRKSGGRKSLRRSGGRKGGKKGGKKSRTTRRH